MKYNCFQSCLHTYNLQFFYKVDRISILHQAAFAKAKSPIAKQYTETRQDTLAEDRPGRDSHLASEPHNIYVICLTTFQNICYCEHRIFFCIAGIYFLKL